MTTFHFSGAVAWNRLGSFVTTGRGVKSVSIKDPATGLVPAGLTQGGVSVTQITTDAFGLFAFTTTDVPGVLINFGLGEFMIYSNEVPALAVASSAPTDTAVATLVTTSTSTQSAMDTRFESKRSTLRANGSDTAATINTFLALSSPLGVKKLIGAFSVSAALTLSASNITLDLSDAAITTSVTASDALTVSGSNVTVLGGSITGPSSWDGTNSEWTYAMIRCTGANPTVRGVTLTNVRRVGIGFKDATGTCRALDNIIVGNYPAGSWTEVETGHIGIGFDPGTGAQLIARGNKIDSCVQGIFLGNYNTGSSIGSVVANNVFSGCHNHAVYGSAGISFCVVANNTTVDCSRPIVMTGEGHVVDGNILTTTLSSGNLSEACGIAMRDPVNCAVTNNTLKGLVHASVPAIDFARTSTNVTLTGNRCIGNKVEVTGTNTAIGIRMGTAAETTFYDNTVANNIVKAPGSTNLGVITWAGANGSQGYGCKCIGNTVIITGGAHGIYVAEMRGLDVKNNTVRLEFSAGGATTLGGVFVTANATGTKVRHNDFEVTSAFGTNITFRAYYEGASTVSANRVGPNRYSLDPTLLTAGVTHVLQSTSSTVINEVGMTGAPATVCGPGSTWTRADGGTSTTFYVKESVASSSTWRAV